MFNGFGNFETLLQYNQALWQEGMTNLQRMSRVPAAMQKSQQVKVGCSPSEVVCEYDRIKLLHYTSDHAPKYKIPLIFTFAMVNRPYIVDLKPGKSVVEHFVKAGFDTYLLDWGIPTPADRYLTLDDYINGYMDDIIDYVCERTGAPQVSLLGYCMGGSMSAMYTALHPKKVQNLIMLAAGVDFEKKDGLISAWAEPKYFDADQFVDVIGNAPPEFLQPMFLMLKPVQNLIEKPINFFEKIEDENFVEDFFAMETWLNDNIPVPGEVFRVYVKYLYQQNLLAKNKMPVGRHIVNLKNITCPVLNLMARNDDLVPCAQSETFNDLTGSTDSKAIKFPAGHIGMAVGSKAQRELWPEVCEWLAERSHQPNATRTRGRRRARVA